jgi:putative serine protease PepD
MRDPGGRGVPDDQNGPGTGSWPGMTAVGRPSPGAAPGGPPGAPWNATPPGATPPGPGAPPAAPAQGGWGGRDATGPTEGWRPGAPQARPEGAAARSWPPPPAAPAAGAPAPQPGQPAGGGLPRRSTAGERLPIFEETRYDWFRTGGNQAAGTRRGAEDLSDLIGTGDPSRLFGDPAGVSETSTSAGLPRRRQGASMAAGLASSGNGTATTYAAPPLGGSVRSPEDLRAALDSYQSGFERGKQEAMRWFKDMPGGGA